MPMMKMLHTKTVPSKSGHMLAFVKNTPKHVPVEAVGDAQAAGAAICDDSGEVDNESAGLQIYAVAAELRRSIILRTMLDIVARNDIADFDGGGKPKLEAIKQRTSMDTSKDEIDELYTILKKARHENTLDTVMYHPNTDLALEAIYTESREELLALAKKYKKVVDNQSYKDLARLPMAEAKTRLVALFAGYSGD